MDNKPQQPASLSLMLGSDQVKKRFEEILGKKANSFISSIISATKSNRELANCDPNSIISSAVIAATLDLPIQGSLGFAAIVPYKENGVPVAQFQMMWRGFVQLGIRSAQYKFINVVEVYEGELQVWNRFTGEFKADPKERKSNKVIGYVASFRLLNGFEKYDYWTVEECEAHARKYSKTYKAGKGKWKDDFDAMGKKTVLKLLLSKFGVMSVDMQTALTYDQSVVRDPNEMEPEYADNAEEASHVVVDEEEFRISTMVADCETPEQLASLKKQADPKYHDLFTAKETELNGR